MSDGESPSADDSENEPVSGEAPPLPDSPGLPIDAPVLEAELVPAPPRLWSAFVVAILAIGAATVTSTVVMGVAAFVDAGAETLRDAAAMKAWIAEFLGTGTGLAILVLPGQLSFCAVALIAARLSPEGVVKRVGLQTGRFPAVTWPIFMAGTPLIGVVSAGLLSLVADEPSEQLKLFERLFNQHAMESLLLLLLMISLIPGVVEEILFRGYVQRRLLQRMHPAVAITIAALLFAAAHIDPMQAVGVFPLGIWLGVIAWRADSIWPAIFGHMGNNAFGIIMAAFVGPKPDPSSMGLPAALLGATLVAFVASLAILIMFRGKKRGVVHFP